MIYDFARDTICAGDIVEDVSSAGGLLMVSGMSGEIDLYSIQADGEAVRSGSYWTYLWIEDTAVYGDRMYIMGFADVVEVVELDSLVDPQRLTMLYFGGRKEVSMRLGYDFAVIPGSWYGLNVYDIIPN